MKTELAIFITKINLFKARRAALARPMEIPKLINVVAKPRFINCLGCASFKAARSAARSAVRLRTSNYYYSK
jgi:hypothetical protein